MRVPRKLRVHRASRRAAPAMHALCLVHRHAEKREAIPKAVPEPQRTKETAKRTIDKHHGDQQHRQHGAFPEGQLSRRREHFRSKRHKRQRALHHARRAYIGAEQRLPDSSTIYDKKLLLPAILFDIIILNYPYGLFYQEIHNGNGTIIHFKIN